MNGVLLAQHTSLSMQVPPQHRSPNGHKPATPFVQQTLFATHVPPQHFCPTGHVFSTPLVQHLAFGTQNGPHRLYPVGHTQLPFASHVVVPGGQQRLLPVEVLVQQTVVQSGPVVPLIPV